MLRNFSLLLLILSFFILSQRVNATVCYSNSECPPIPGCQPDPLSAGGNCNGACVNPDAPGGGCCSGTTCVTPTPIPGPVVCSGPAGGPCAGTCPSGQTCRAATPQNGGACGCHASGGGGCDRRWTECRKGCNAANRGTTCGLAKDGSQKYNCQMCCRVTNPTPPTLLSPGNNSSVSATTVTLRWSPPTNWGNDCFSNTSKKFLVYWGYTAMTPNLLANVPDTTTSTTLTGVVGRTYYWKVVAQNNQDYNNAESETWKFTIAPVTIKVRAVQVSPTDLTCAAAAASATGIAGSVHKFTPGSPSNPPAQTQAGAAYAQFSGLPGGTYTLDSVIPPTYSQKLACWTKTGTGSASGTGMSAVAAGGDTVTWDLGYTTGTPWVQASGGDVYADSNLISFVASGATPRVFIADGASGLPGLATYGESYNFDSGAVDKGKTLVSSKNWLSQDTFPLVDYYALFYRRFGGTPGSIDYVSPSSPIAQPVSRAAPYYVTGNMTTSGDWTVGNGENLVFFVDGNLTIAGKITITGSGFVAFIVNGDISVDPAVGVAYTSSIPALEGVYVTSPKGAFHTGASTSVGHERFVGRGTFIAGSFALERDLDPAGTNGQNDTTSAELFTYNPRLLVTMPDKMKESPIDWQEVAP